MWERTNQSLLGCLYLESRVEGPENSKKGVVWETGGGRISQTTPFLKLSAPENSKKRVVWEIGGIRALYPMAKPNAWPVRPQESNALCHACFPFQDFRPKCTRNRPISQTTPFLKLSAPKLAGFEPCTRWPSPMPGPLGHRSQMHCVMCASLFKTSDPSAPGTARFLKPPPFWNFQPPKTPKNGWFEKLAGFQPRTQAQCLVR